MPMFLLRRVRSRLALLRRPPMSVIWPLSGAKRASASDCRTIAIY